MEKHRPRLLPLCFTNRYLWSVLRRSNKEIRQAREKEGKKRKKVREGGRDGKTDSEERAFLLRPSLLFLTVARRTSTMRGRHCLR